MRVINYYGNDGKSKQISYDLVFDQWIKSLGGKDFFCKRFKHLSTSQIYNLPTEFILFFMRNYNAELPNYDDPLFQEYLVDNIVFNQKMDQLITDYNTRPFSPSSIIILAIIGLAIFGLVSMCK